MEGENIWIHPNEGVVVLVVWLALFGGTVLLGGATVWAQIRRRKRQEERGAQHDPARR